MKKTLIFLSLLLVLATSAFSKEKASSRSHNEGSAGIITIIGEDFKTLN
ncbi:hypothetical protein PM10SUCC1_32630 [Propionigenium maris DSM 9537]|uniref:Uncharacterized protein n=1 Tax=Propionigenium maris DSM 9537 TaxID=1123000 RepID=A0A9W6GPL9_9FUSO|nr:hypothetical protein [Propionigenium maris]GLI57749.1 hypothetical protein PM10SUCC1_32630 [Propionigenium maris DSM 9537]